MARIIERSNFRVEVYPRSPSDLGGISIGGIQRSDNETERLCEEIADDIRRHVDNLPSRWARHDRGVQVTWDGEAVCEHCRSAWTEKSHTYNGGCCSKDDLNAPAEETTGL